MHSAVEPWLLLAAWLEEAVATEPRVPEAMQVATVDAQGIPSLRTVLLKDHGAEGMVFYTHFESRKGRELRDNDRCAFLFHFKGLERQVLGEGTVTRVDDATADAYFASRARGSQLSAWASDQSAPLSDSDALQAKVTEIQARYDGAPVPRPSFWGGYRIHPTRMEFWQGKPDRLHERLEFTAAATGWSRQWLQP